ncbi:GDP-mannose 4,6 dehydratase [Leifsonia sp. Leaf325]|nr:GDP-mannose 4,6-dehydratase [Leifsonia sp. Leaf325]KQQ95835.1 GDP-mannose 4,6 dehydratase [Leifsonia sp. Leaf325]
MTADRRDERVLVTGANGQDGTYLVRTLLADGHAVHGMCHSEAGAARLVADFPEATAHVCDLGDTAGITRMIDEISPTHVYNLAGNTSVARSWEFPAETADVLGTGPIRLLEAAWKLGERTGETVRFVQASSAEIFGDASVVPQDESTPRVPVTPYGVAKTLAHEMAGVYRERGMFASTAILYNHESPLRPPSFVARKISREVARIATGQSEQLTLGNIDVRRDWGYAPDYVDAMLHIGRAAQPGDFVVATGQAHSVRDFVDAAFRHVGIDDWDRYVSIDPAFYRPADPQELVGDSSRLRGLGWNPSVDFGQLVTLMVDHDLELLRQTE